ncbi:unnamed protein product [Camellia sinensis]
MSPPQPTATAVEEGGATTFPDIHQDILSTHILTRLDGPSLASASSTSSQLHALSSHHHLWTTICHSTFPSTTTSPRLLHLLSSFPGGPRSFFSLSFPLLLPNFSPTTTSPPPAELISAVDVHYKNNLIFTKVQETETTTSWFMCSPFRIDLLDTKDIISTTIRHRDDDGAWTSLSDEVTLSWILIDPVGNQAANLSTHKAVSVQRHWLSGEVQVRFGSVLAGGNRRGPTSELVHCGIVVTCGESEGGELQVREVSLQVEDMDGMHLTGKDSLVILHRALEGKRGHMRREEEGRRRYREYMEMKRERRERKLKTEWTLDMLCVAFGVTIFSAFWLFLLCT